MRKSTKKGYKEYCQAKREMGEIPLTKEEFDELNEIGDTGL
jgi:hypothetical protein